MNLKRCTVFIAVVLLACLPLVSAASDSWSVAPGWQFNMDTGPSTTPTPTPSPSQDANATVAPTVKPTLPPFPTPTPSVTVAPSASPSVHPSSEPPMYVSLGGDIVVVFLIVACLAVVSVGLFVLWMRRGRCKNYSKAVYC